MKWTLAIWWPRWKTTQMYRGIAPLLDHPQSPSLEGKAFLFAVLEIIFKRNRQLPLYARDPVILRQPLEAESTEPITEQDNELLAKHKEYRYMSEKMTWDPHCYECKVRYRDPKAKDLVMYLHAWRYKVTTDNCISSLRLQDIHQCNLSSGSRLGIPDQVA